MRRQILILSVLALIAAVVLSAGCTSASSGTKIEPSLSPSTTATVLPGASSGTKVVPPVSPSVTVTGSSGASSCGFTTCHGLDLACGTNAPQVCTMEYRIGDKCRQYARCDSSGGSCTLVTDPKFASCKACVEQCAARETADPAAAFDCEAKC